MKEIETSVVLENYNLGTFIAGKDRGIIYGSKNFFLFLCRKLSPVRSSKVIIQERSYSMKIEELIMARGNFSFIDAGN